jgi:sodium-dependent phosphate cotransporter
MSDSALGAEAAPSLSSPVRLREVPREGGAVSSNLRNTLQTIGRVIYLLLLLYLFLVAIQLFGDAIKKLGANAAASLVTGLENPFAGLSVGILATVLVQSSSVTTSLIVGMVGTGVLPLSIAVPMVMGANIGTSVTNTLVALGSVTRNEEFRRAFAGATVHDFFNILTVAVLFPLELATGFLRRGAEYLVSVLPTTEAGAHYKSPIKGAVKWLAGIIQSNCEALGLSGGVLSAALVVIALALIFVALTQITRTMRVVMADRIEAWLNRVLGRSGLLGVVIGIIITVMVQSSSITTSLLVPMFGAGILQLEAGFPIMVGANIGTTVTAMLAAMVAGPGGLTIALVHLLFNLTGTAIFMSFAVTRQVPLAAARGLANMAIQNRLWVAAYILSVFLIIPALGILIWR